MEALATHLVKHIVQHPDELRAKAIEGDATIIVEMVVHPDDEERVRGENGRTLRAINTILSAAAGRRKATLDLVDADALGAEE